MITQNFNAPSSSSSSSLTPNVARKILVPCDGSKASMNALRRAAKLFLPIANNADFKIELILLYVVPYIDIPLPLDEYTIANETAEIEYIRQTYFYLREKTILMLDSTRANILCQGETRALSVRTEVLYGNPSEKIIEFAKSEKVDVIVIGNVGLTGLSMLKTLGSVSRGVSERSDIPVMIVHFRE